MLLISTPVFHEKHFFIWSHLGFISWRIYSLLRRVRHNSKIWQKTTFQITNDPTCHFSWEMIKNSRRPKNPAGFPYKPPVRINVSRQKDVKYGVSMVVFFFMCIFSMCRVVQDPFLKSCFSTLLRRVWHNSKTWPQKTTF